MDVQRRRQITLDYERKNLLSKDQLFRVRKRGVDTPGPWQPMPGHVVTTYFDNEYEFEHIGPNTKETVDQYFGEPKKGRAA